MQIWLNYLSIFKSRETRAEVTNLSTPYMHNAEAVAENIMGESASGPDTRRDLPFRESAFEDDRCVCLDEIKFAAETLFQCMEAAIADEQINLKRARKRFARHERHPNRPSRLTRVEFPEVTAETYLKITEGRPQISAQGKTGRHSKV
jgi:hypothetical protein